MQQCSDADYLHGGRCSDRRFDVFFDGDLAGLYHHDALCHQVFGERGYERSGDLDVMGFASSTDVDEALWPASAAQRKGPLVSPRDAS